MPCLICRLPVDMDFPVLGRLIYRHVNRVARRVARAQREAERKAPYEAGTFMGIKLIVDEDQEPGTAALVGADGQRITMTGIGTETEPPATP